MLEVLKVRPKLGRTILLAPLQERHSLRQGAVSGQAVLACEVLNFGKEAASSGGGKSRPQRYRCVDGEVDVNEAVKNGVHFVAREVESRDEGGGPLSEGVLRGKAPNAESRIHAVKR